MPQLFAYTDGACSGNPGPGGWGVLMLAREDGVVIKERELMGGEAQTTNNRMELTAAIKALEALIEPCAITLHSDSKYVLDGITKWVHGWQKNGWKNASKQPVRNADLWHELIAAARPHQVEWVWVKGHSGHAENDRVDALACAAAEQAGRS